jgi:hypothetical protein
MDELLDALDASLASPAVVEPRAPQPSTARPTVRLAMLASLVLVAGAAGLAAARANRPPALADDDAPSAVEHADPPAFPVGAPSHLASPPPLPASEAHARVDLRKPPAAPPPAAPTAQPPPARTAEPLPAKTAAATAIDITKPAANDSVARGPVPSAGLGGSATYDRQ